MKYQKPIRDVPEGCLEIPGFILELPDRSGWLTKDLGVTDKWNERGVWNTPELAEEALNAFRSTSPKEADHQTNP